MFLKSKCRGKSDLGVCMTSVLAKGMQPRSANFRRILQPNTLLHWKSALRSRILFASTKVMHTHLDPTFLYILILRTYTKFVWKNKMLALGACFPQPCSSDGRRFAVSRSRWIPKNHFVRLHKDEFDEMLCKLDSTKFARSFEQTPTLPGGVGYFSNERGFSVESSLQRISLMYLCGNESTRR